MNKLNVRMVPKWFSYSFTCCMLLWSVISHAQEKHLTRTGNVVFEASVPSFEEVKAKHANVSAVLTDSGEIAALILMKGFRFKLALMEEHFNENYTESTRYPQATFKGRITDFTTEQLTETPVEYSAAGVMLIHGVNKDITIPVLLSRNGDAVILSSEFVLLPEDFNIKIPKIVRNKIAETVDVSVSLELKTQ
ncbi:YceI family protein [Galbibacter sp. EGI 63066]|uniref:YceI family protein n=1 Tax=Galbibacter sp. EGI 63066 TaxID=2993559 RepID=UPI002249476C|nr:YceI family protein [Galbibacter sp. EGI 63066]MCX2679311.1 YceI family protein [Galbibacter sp. EGI 63066]